MVKKLVDAGMDIARLNFSHGDHREHLKLVEVVGQVRADTGRPLALLGDTRGPEVRLGEVALGTRLQDGQYFTLTTTAVIGDAKRASVSYDGLAGDVKPGVRILIDDGQIELVVESVAGTEIGCRVIHGGAISAKRGVNVPGVPLFIPFISDQDRLDLAFAIEHDFDFLAASFVSEANNLHDLRGEISRLGGAKIKIIAKIENAEGVENIDEIIQEADAIMVARGDLGVEIAMEEIPIIQKHLIAKACAAHREVITATQMLESMVHSPKPTRAEVSDVANAIYDGTSAIMLSGETSVGSFPVEAVAMMARIALSTERDIDHKQRG
jgi:pyruvate kinase